jgi:ABC-type polysaccharide/polyol phosphate export permease
MNQLKKILGIVWMVLAPAVIYLLITGAVQNIDSVGTKDINKPIPWIIIIAIFTPIAIGLMIFGFYSFKGEYDKIPETSDEL